eukprot:SAG31_NODE_7093_length_1791_cov_0.833924_1_plen_52_part_10
MDRFGIYEARHNAPERRIFVNNHLVFEAQRNKTSTTRRCAVRMVFLGFIDLN